MELHLRIPPEKWCITRTEFHEFTRDVRALWKQGVFPANDRDLDTRQNSSSYGPNLYEVNEHYVKPVTRRAGGMSYALMKHPEGLRCQVFISHAWAEGIFELDDLVRRGWPRLQLYANLYCCLLANPQNLDISALLNVPPVESPFAKAMQSASHLLVIPNDRFSIYTRLWCVYEAYLGTCWQKTCIVPARPRTSKQCQTFMLTVLVPMVAGALLGNLCWLFVQTSAWRDLFMAVKMMMMVCVTGTAVCYAALIFSSCFHSRLGYYRCSRVVSVSLLFLSTMVMFPWMALKPQFLSDWDHFQHYFFPPVLCLFNLIRVAQLNQQLLELQELQRQASHLNFQTLADATCTDPNDERRIRAAIAGHEEEVDITIRVLMVAGAYTTWLRRAYEAGVDIKGKGTSDLIIKTGLAMVLWSFAGAHSAGFLMAGGSCQLDRSWVIVSMVVCFCLAAALPFATFGLERCGPERAVFAVRAWTFAAMLALGLPVLVSFDDHLLAYLFLPSEALPAHAHCPDQLLRLMVVFFRPAVAAVFTFVVFLGPERLLKVRDACVQVAGYSRCPSLAFTISDSEESATTSSDGE